MNCRECGSEELMAHITMAFEIPLALRSGSVKIGGQKVSAIDAKLEWEKQRPLRGPVFCNSCGTEHYIDTRVKEGLMLGRVMDARLLEPEKGIA